MNSNGSSVSTRRIKFDRDVGGAGHGDAQAGQVVRVPVGVVEDRLVDRRRPGQHGDLLVGDATQDGVHVEDGLGEHGRPRGDAGQDPGLQPEHVEVGVVATGLVSLIR